MNEMVEWAHGKIAPLVVAKKNMRVCGKGPDGALLAEKNQVLAHLFMQGMEVTKRSLAIC